MSKVCTQEEEKEQACSMFEFGWAQVLAECDICGMRPSHKNDYAEINGNPSFNACCCEAGMPSSSAKSMILCWRRGKTMHPHTAAPAKQETRNPKASMYGAAPILRKDFPTAASAASFFGRSESYLMSVVSVQQICSSAAVQVTGVPHLMD